MPDSLSMNLRLWGRRGGMVSDAFTGGAGALSDHAPTSLGNPSAWANAPATWTIDGSGLALNTPTLSAEIATGTTTVGTWYYITATEVDHFFTGCAIGHYWLATSAKTLDANNKVKSLTRSELFAPTPTGFPIGYNKVTDTVIAASSVQGVFICLDSYSNPQNAFVAVLNRTSATGMVWALNSGTWTSLINTAVTYAANAEMHLLFDGTYLYFWYNNALVGTRQDVSSYTTVIKNTLHGLFSVSSGNTFSGVDIKPLQYGADLFDAGAGTFESGTYNWAVGGSNTIANVAGELRVTYVDNAVGAYTYLSAAGDLTTNLTVGSIYRIDWSGHEDAAGTRFEIVTTGTTYQNELPATKTSYTNFFVADHASTNYLRMGNFGAGDVAYCDDLILRQVQ